MKRLTGILILLSLAAVSQSHALTQDEYDRMRIISPIEKYEKLSAEQINQLMESNFHRALDARYASSKGILYAAFIHPMSSLTPAELDAALNQVAQLALTFGTSYSGGTLSFGGE